MVDPITVTCLSAGSFTLSAGTLEPAIVLERLLVALSVLSLPEYRRLLAPDGPLAGAPRAALRDGSSSWWDTHDAGMFLRAVFGAINAAAPPGYACSWVERDRIELRRIDTSELDWRQLGAGVSAPPAVSVVRERVR